MIVLSNLSCVLVYSVAAVTP